jgi:DNA/RNA-binding domain of Phe-tRNA-synthetase-like protein
VAKLRYTIDSEVFRDVPEFVRGIVVIENLDNSGQHERLGSLFRGEMYQAAEDGGRTTTDPRITAWEETYKTFPLPRGERIHPGHGTLLKRLKKGDAERIPFISPLVAISNIIAVKYMMPCGVFDTGRVTGDLMLTAATGEESFLPFGKDTATGVVSGEVILLDSGQNTVVCRAWNSRGGQTTAVSADTKNAIIDIDCLSRIVGHDVLDEALSEAVSLVSQFCGGLVRVERLSSDNRQIAI